MDDFTFSLDRKSNKKIKPDYFYPENHRTNLPIATPAARVSHSAPGSLPAANAKILIVIFWDKNRRAGLRVVNCEECSVFFDKLREDSEEGVVF